MKRLRLVIIILAILAPVHTVIAQRTLTPGEVTVTARRPMKEIGVQKTSFDSAQLKENVALSMADILTFNSSVFVKSYGRATLSTVSFRGTSPSHTQVSWNGMRINSPMLGMTDFSSIPAYFIDRASLLHGTSSVTATGGGLGGLVSLSTLPDAPDGFGLQYIQGIGSFKTFDEFLRLTYHDDHWTVSTRAVYSSSPNDFTYINRDKKLNIYDSDHNIIGQYHPRERNKSGAFHDLHLLQEVYYNTLKGDRFGLSAWFTDSRRHLPLLTTDYGSDIPFRNFQHDVTTRLVASWDHTRSKFRTGLKAGYLNSYVGYDYLRAPSPDKPMNWMTRSRSRINTVYGQAEAEYSPRRQWYFTVSASLYQHFVKSQDRTLTSSAAVESPGYDKARVEFSGAVSAKWQPTDRIGLSAVIREESYGTAWAAPIPALFADAVLLPKINLVAKASVSRNHRFPTLNDLYFQPGGNPDLQSEHGFTYDAGLSFDIAHADHWSLGGSATWFDSRIDNWILWLPTTKGFFSPRNVKEVHAYGIELKANLAARLGRGWLLDLNGNYSWTPSINRGEPISPADRSVGQQLPYVPRHSASVTGRLSWRSWSFLYKWAYYSRRFTMSSSDNTLTGYLPPYFMSNISLEKSFSWRPADMSLKFAVNNLFDEEYLSVLSRPMPGINFEFFISITPHFGKSARK